VATASGRGRGRSFLGWAVVALLALFGAQAACQWYYVRHPPAKAAPAEQGEDDPPAERPSPSPR
jgi:hypothetical protein